jgi:hypothetical protein
VAPDYDNVEEIYQLNFIWNWQFYRWL